MEAGQDREGKSVTYLALTEIQPPTRRLPCETAVALLFIVYAFVTARLTDPYTYCIFYLSSCMIPRLRRPYSISVHPTDSTGPTPQKLKPHITSPRAILKFLPLAKVNDNIKKETVLISTPTLVQDSQKTNFEIV